MEFLCETAFRAESRGGQDEKLHLVRQTFLCSTKREGKPVLALETKHWSNFDVVAQGYSSVGHEGKYRNNSVCELNGSH